jgi:hypothetical protein
MTKAKLQNPQDSLSATFARTAAAIQSHAVTVRELLALIGEQGLLLFAVFAAVPFLLPISIPGSSTILGALIFLIGVGVMMNAIPWMPDRLLAYQLQSKFVVTILEKASVFFKRFERLIKPRLLALSHSETTNRINGLVLIVIALLLMAPLPFIPLTNTIPAIAIVCLCIGMAERDGVLILIGYVASVISTVYIGAILWGIWFAGANATEWVRGLFG